MGDDHCVTASVGHRTPGLTRRRVTRHYLDHASTSPPRPEVVAAMRRGSRDGRRRPRAHPRRGARGPRRGRDGPGAGGGAARGPAPLGRVHERRDRGDRHGVLGGGRAGRPPGAGRGRALRRAARRAEAARRRSTVVGVDGLGRVDPDELLGRDPARHRARPRPVGQPRGRHACSPSPRWWRVPRARACSSTSTRRRPPATMPIDFDELGRRPAVGVRATSSAARPGVGALLVRRGLRVRPLLVGGDQERARRAGLEPVPALAGFGAACASPADGGARAEAPRSAAHRPHRRRPCRRSTGVRVYGDPIDRLPHLVCLGIDGVEPQAVLLGLDRAGVAAHSGQRVLVRGARAVAGARGHGRRRPPQPAPVASAGAPPTPTSTPP